MLRLLLDEHISPIVADGFRRRNQTIPISAVTQEPAFKGLSDVVLLAACAESRTTLVTFDCRTIQPLLKRWAEEDRAHGGVIFVDEETIAPQDFGALIRSLVRLADALGGEDWTNRTTFLSR